MKYSKKTKVSGISSVGRENLSQLLRKSQTAITISEAAEIWGVGRIKAAKQLAHYAKQGWLKRVRVGVYMPVPLTSPTKDIVAEEPFAIAEKLFSPCYIGGMNAANYWDLTEQIFRTITVMTQKQVRERSPVIAGSEYDIHTINKRYFFGLKVVWFNDVKVKISDPTRTIVDMMIFPSFCGGIRFIVDVLINYFNSEYKDIDLFIEYLSKANNGAATKRLGFLLDVNFPNESNLIDYCSNNLTEGYAKLSSSLECPRLISRWRVWVPESWKDRLNDK